MGKFALIVGMALLASGCGKDDKKAPSKDDKSDQPGGGGGGAAGAKNAEAELHLRKLGKNLKMAYVANMAFPTATIPLTPAKPCCEGADKKCAADAAAWAPWQAMEFAVDEPHRFQYSYESDGKKYTAKAVGDLDCDGTAITYVLEGTGAGDTVTENLVAADPSKD